MKWAVVGLTVFSMIFAAIGQNSGPTIRVDVVGSFVWGEDGPSGAISSTIKDPLTGHSLHRLSYGGIEITSRIGFEGLGANNTGILISYTAVVTNSTNSAVSARFGGFTIDSRTVPLLKLVQRDKKDKKLTLTNKKGVVDLNHMHCFISGALPDEKFFSSDPSSQVYSVAPQTATIVSAIVRDPREYGSVLCSTTGCYPTGTVRYVINVDGHDYVFIWNGRSALYCGK